LFVRGGTYPVDSAIAFDFRAVEGRKRTDEQPKAGNLLKPFHGQKNGFSVDLGFLLFVDKAQRANSACGVTVLQSRGTAHETI
jgi:hypothetical protein